MKWLLQMMASRHYLCFRGNDMIDYIGHFASQIDGYGVCELIRKQSDVPIIMLTALSGEEDQIRGLDLQVDDYITKPFSMPILLRKIAAVLRRSKREKMKSLKSSLMAIYF